MPKIRFVGAILLSIVLIVGALWYRFVRVAPYTAELTVVRDADQILIENTYSENFLNTEATLPLAASTTPITQTGVVSRQLFSDYLSLKSQGQVTSESLVAIANNHAESIASAAHFDPKIEKIGSGHLNVVVDTEENLAVYGNAMSEIRSKYKNLVVDRVNKSGGIINTNDKSFFDFMREVGKLYQESADEFMLVKVPMSLVGNHVVLINTYLENEAVTKFIGETNQDPLQTYAALNLFVQNSAQETNLILNIQRAMMANGITLKNSL